MSDHVINRLSELKRPAKEFPRTFIPDEVDFSTWEKIEPLFKDLLERNLDSVEDVEKWLLDSSELGAVISEEGSRRYIEMTCNTDDPTKEQAYLHFIENISPKLKPVQHNLTRKLVDCPHTDNLDKKRYEVLVRSARNSVELFREENIPLETEVDRLSQQYQKLMGAQTVNFKGEERTMQQMGVFLIENDRDLREEAWKASTERRMKDVEKLDELYDKMLELRNQIAKNAGFDNFRDYMFRSYDRFDYTPDDCFQFHEAVEKFVVPITKNSLEERCKVLNLETVRPWDTGCDLYGRDPLKPFKNTVDLAKGCREIFGRVDKELGDSFQKMIDLGLLDLDSRKGKAPGGYQSSLEELRLPFIFMNAVGLNRDVYTLLHEGGHAFHQFAVHDEPLVQYRHSPMEFAEVASMSMEKLGSNYLDVFYSEGDAARAYKEALEGDVSILPWISIVDAFQHWIYTNKGHTAAERSDFFVSLMKRFTAGTDWSGFEDALRARWQIQLHIFEVPFYYIEYGIALLGALQIWSNSKRDLPKAITSYKNALKLGGGRPLPELFEAADAKFDFSADTIKPLMKEVQEEITKQSAMESK